MRDMTNLRNDITYRDAHAGDADVIAQLHTDSWRRTYRGMMTDEFLDRRADSNRRAVWRLRLDAPAANQFVRVAEQGGSIVGFICAFADEDHIWGSYIDNLHVAPAVHRRGIGRMLMCDAAAWLCDVEPARGVYLWVMEGNAPARAFYARLGASNAGTAQKADPGGGTAPNCRYVWPSPRALLSACDIQKAEKT